MIDGLADHALVYPDDKFSQKLGLGKDEGEHLSIEDPFEEEGLQALVEGICSLVPPPLLAAILMLEAVGKLVAQMLDAQGPAQLLA